MSLLLTNPTPPVRTSVVDVFGGGVASGTAATRRRVAHPASRFGVDVVGEAGQRRDRGVFVVVSIVVVDYDAVGEHQPGPSERPREYLPATNTDQRRSYNLSGAGRVGRHRSIVASSPVAP